MSSDAMILIIKKSSFQSSFKYGNVGYLSHNTHTHANTHTHTHTQRHTERRERKRETDIYICMYISVIE